MQNIKCTITQFLSVLFSSPDACKEYRTKDVKIYWRNAILVDNVQALAEFARKQQACFPDFTFVINDIVVDGDRVAVRLEQHGSLAKEWEGISNLGAKFKVSEMMFFKLKGNRISEMWPLLDMELKKQQLNSNQYAGE